MKFCFLTTFFPPYHFGGDAVFAASLANALVEDGHHVEVAHCVDSFDLLSGGVPPSPVAVDPRVVVHALRSDWGALSPLVTYFSGRPALKRPDLQRILAAEFDVIHWHNPSLMGAPGGFVLGNGIRLCTLHDFWLLCPTHHLFKFQREVCMEKSCFRCQLSYHRPPQPWRIGGFLEGRIGGIDRFIAPSAFVRDVFRRSSLVIDPVVLPHFLDRSAAGTASSPEGIWRSYYFFAGRLEKAKGLQTVLPLFRDGRRLLIAGTGGNEAELRRQAENQPDVVFLGRVPHDELNRLYAGARATIVPSLSYETFGMTVLESWACATPVLTSQCGGPSELVESSGGGFVYSDTAELENHLCRFDQSDDLIGQLGSAGRDRLGNYSRREHLTAYYRLIEEVCSKPQALESSR